MKNFIFLILQTICLFISMFSFTINEKTVDIIMIFWNGIFVYYWLNLVIKSINHALEQ